MNLPEVVILTNDDGIGAPGLQVLQDIVGERAIIVAPSGPRSGCSHYVTMDHPISVEQVGERAWAVDGTPGDCVRLGIKHFAPDAALVLSGINEGGNLGHDIYLSGTVAAAREAAFHRLPAVALSQYFRPDKPIDWQRTGQLARRALADVLDRDLPQGSFWNVNFPHLDNGREPQVVPCAYCTQPLPTKYSNGHNGYLYVRGLYHSRACHPGTDVSVCFGGDIALTLLSL